MHMMQPPVCGVKMHTQTHTHTSRSTRTHKKCSRHLLRGAEMPTTRHHAQRAYRKCMCLCCSLASHKKVPTALACMCAAIRHQNRRFLPHLCVYVCICAYVCVCERGCLYVCMRVGVLHFVTTQISAHCICTCVSVCVCVCVCLCRSLSALQSEIFCVYACACECVCARL